MRHSSRRQRVTTAIKMPNLPFLKPQLLQTFDNELGIVTFTFEPPRPTSISKRPPVG